MVTRKGIHAKWMPFLVSITGYGYVANRGWWYGP
jgi:hypothetical protein